LDSWAGEGGVGVGLEALKKGKSLFLVTGACSGPKVSNVAARGLDPKGNNCGGKGLEPNGGSCSRV
jgi:hypothetical protein